jgi:transposase
MDVHRSFAQIAIVEDGICRDEGRIGVRPEELRAWASTLSADDEVALEATTNSDAIATLLRPLVRRVVVSNPRKTRAIAEAKVKTDKVDARILAQLLAADFLPGTWVADERTRMLRRLVMRRSHLVKQRTRVKNQVHAILTRNLVPTCPHADLFAGVGRRWLARQELPVDERRSVEALIRQLDFHGEELAQVDRDVALEAIDDQVVARLMTSLGSTSPSRSRSSLRSATSAASRVRIGSSPTSVSTRACASPEKGPQATAGSPKRGRRRLVGCSSRPPSPPRARRGRCAPSTGASRNAVASRSRSSLPPES